MSTPSPVAPDAAPNAHGFIDYMDERGAVLDVRGWMVDLAAPFDEVELVLADGQRFPAAVVEREDLVPALPRFPWARTSGFHVEVPRERLPAGRELSFTLAGQQRGTTKGVLHAAFYRAPVRLPHPPPALMKRVAHTELGYCFEAGGMKGCRDLTSALRARRPLSGVRRVLDWGCGSARVTRHLRTLLSEAELHGADIDAEAVAWSRASIPGIEFGVCPFEPPLAAPDAFFDVILAASVFTHLTRPAQERWLAELRRVLAPGGILVATTLGEFAVRYRLPSPPPGLALEGIDDSQRDATLDAILPPGLYRATYQTRAYTEREWGRVLEPLYFEDGGYTNIQDLWLLRKRS